ncbi:hypothetical protein MMC28_000757 [Mycoblastus sanguinarius]|nr:hypothetical protein [Mycoblastus sanguinarius]
MALSHNSEGSSFSAEGTPSPSSELITSSSDFASSNNMLDFDDFSSAPDAFLHDSFDFNLASAGAHFEPINHPAPAQASSNVQTVSPKDIMVDSMSAPPSSAFTELTTPGTSTFESPFMANSSETSPLFAEDNFDEDPNQWPSLFEPQEEVNNGPVSHFNATPAPAIAPVAPKMSRNSSSPGQSSPRRSSQQGRHSFAAGIAPKRRDKPLPAITIEDPNDAIAVKRARNTLAARKSREKRVEKTEALVNQVTALEEEVEHWKSIALRMGHVE